VTRIIFLDYLTALNHGYKPLPIDPCWRCQDHPEPGDQLMLRNPNALESERGIRSGLLDRIGNAANLNNMKAQADLEASPQWV
jgi:hypothetical protein